MLKTGERGPMPIGPGLGLEISPRGGKEVRLYDALLQNEQGYAYRSQIWTTRLAYGLQPRSTSGKEWVKAFRLSLPL
jgi:hypothetical protein